MTINPIDEVKKCMKVLSDEKENLDRKLEALDTLKEWCEDLNFAIDFEKLNGYSSIVSLLDHESSEVRALCCDIVGTCAQNNPYCQKSLLEFKILPLMFKKLDKDVAEVKIKALFAISCLTRDFEPGQAKLLEENFMDILMKSLKQPIEKLQIKTCFLFSSICNNNSIKAELTKKRLIENLIDMYNDTDSNIHEHVLSAINTLIDDNPDSVKQAIEMKQINFKELLQRRISIISNDPRFEEELYMAKKCLILYFKIRF